LFQSLECFVFEQAEVDCRGIPLTSPHTSEETSKNYSGEQPVMLGKCQLVEIGFMVVIKCSDRVHEFQCGA